MSRNSLWRKARLLVNLGALLGAWLLVVANTTPEQCKFSEDFTADYDITTNCGSEGSLLRTSRVRLVSDGSAESGAASWETDAETLSGDEVVARAIASGSCWEGEAAEVRSFRLYLTEGAGSSAVRFVCGTAVHGSLGSSCDEELNCEDCEAEQNVCTILVEKVIPGS